MTSEYLERDIWNRVRREEEVEGRMKCETLKVQERRAEETNFLKSLQRLSLTATFTFNTLGPQSVFAPSLPLIINISCFIAFFCIVNLGPGFPVFVTTYATNDKCSLTI